MGGWVVTESMDDWMDHEYEKWQGDYNWMDELWSFHCIFYLNFLNKILMFYSFQMDAQYTRLL